MVVLGAIAVLAWAWLLLGHGRFWSAGPVLPLTPSAAANAAHAAHAALGVCIVVPARNEAATIAAVVRSLLAQDHAGPLGVVVVDDCSTDGTGALAAAAGRGDARLTVLQGAPRPDGWSGKLWAVHQGVAQAAGAPLLLLTDADILHAPGHLSALVGKLDTDRLDLVSEMVALNCASTAERWLVPAFVFFFQLLYPFAAVNDPRRPIAAAAGGSMLVRAEALARIGGIAALRGALIDDVALARRIKRSGGSIWLGHATQAASRRPYPHAADIWRMVARTAFVQLRHSWVLLAGCTLGMGVIWLAPPALALAGHGTARLLGLCAWLAAAASFVPTLHRFHLGAWRAAFLPAIALFYMAATLGSAIDHLRGAGVRWKDRAYLRPTTGHTAR